jgi:hypothetical protein
MKKRAVIVNNVFCFSHTTAMATAGHVMYLTTGHEPCYYITVTTKRTGFLYKQVCFYFIFSFHLRLPRGPRPFASLSFISR